MSTTYHTTHCTLCNKDWDLKLPYDESVFRMRWDMWAKGGLIQSVFPELTRTEREGLKTGLCPACCNRLFEPEKS